MAIFGRRDQQLSSPKTPATDESTAKQNASEPNAPAAPAESAEPSLPEDETGIKKTPETIPLPQSPPVEHTTPSVTNTTSSTTETKLDRPAAQARRFSFKTFSYVYNDPTQEKVTEKKREHKHELSVAKEQQKKRRAAQALTKRLVTPLHASSDRKAKESAMILRSMIIGPLPNAATPQITKAVARPQLQKVKSELSSPRSANKVIAQLRALPLFEEAVAKKDGQTVVVENTSRGPIHAVCLAHTDADEDALHFSHLTVDLQDIPEASLAVPSLDVKSAATASLQKLTAMFNNMHLVDLIKSPDLGLGQPGDGEGLLAGAVPTAETVVKGIQQITPQLMALGFATGRAVLPNHNGVYPPTDRISVLTYWWGLEIALPPPTVAYLSNVQSISNSTMNFLSAIALINNGVREILPFVRYISQFMDFEFSAIKAQDRGKGVVCAATWIMPAAMVPRPWDFPDPPEDSQLQDVELNDKGSTTDSIPETSPLPTVIVSAPTENSDDVELSESPSISLS